MIVVDNVLLWQQKKQNEKNKISQKRLHQFQLDNDTLPEKKMCKKKLEEVSFLDQFT